MASLLVILKSLLATIIVASAAQTVFSLPSTQEWEKFSISLQGRLKETLPLAAPCFSNVNGKNHSVDEASCNAVKVGYGIPDFRSLHYSAFMFPQWERCQRAEEKCLLDPSNTSDPAALDVSCQQGSVSQYYIELAGPEDVQKAFSFANKTGISLSIKASGHDYKGRSSLKGSLALWTRHLTSMKYAPNFIPDGGNETYDRAITFGVDIKAGVPFEDLYAFADSHNVTVVGGYHHTVTPSGGWVQGGGHSILTPVYGLGVDRVIQFKVVTPDGAYRIVNKFQNADLFWALRGGGGSTFGVVLESTFRVEPQLKLQVASLSFTKNATNYQPFLKLIVDQSFKWGTEGWGGHMGPTNIINVTPLLTLEEAKSSLQPVTDYVNAQPGAKTVIEELSSWKVFFDKYVGNAQASVGVENTLLSRLISTDLFQSEQGRQTLADTMVRMIDEHSVNPYIVVGTPFLYNQTSPDETSTTLAWRKALWQIGGHTGWQFNSTVAEIRRQYTIAGEITQWLRDITPGSGAYFNEGDLYEPDHEVIHFPSLTAGNVWVGEEAKILDMGAGFLKNPNRGMNGVACLDAKVVAMSNWFPSQD